MGPPRYLVFTFHCISYRERKDTCTTIMAAVVTFFVFFQLIIIPSVEAQVANKDLNLPGLFTPLEGPPVKTAAGWSAQRRPELLKTFERSVYGKAPGGSYQVSSSVDHTNPEALDGKAIGKSVTVTVRTELEELSFNVYLFLPKSGPGPYPIFLGLNFYGNHTTHADEAIPISTAWTPNNSQFCISDHRADEVSRGVRAYRWPAERIIKRGYGLAVVYSGDIDPDFDDGFKNGVHSLFNANRNEQSWGTITAWAWGLSRALDYLEQEPMVNAKKVAVMGHSRLGKAALWAGARDERFALVISNDSGCGGAALSRRKSGERLEDINRNFPHWFASNFRSYNGKEEQLPVDQHMLMALIAPRPLYVASADQDNWADPYGEYLSLYYAAPVYELLGYPSALKMEHPKVNQPVHSGRLGYHIRNGRHEVTRYDWERFMDFADQHLK